MDAQERVPEVVSVLLNYSGPTDNWRAIVADRAPQFSVPGLVTTSSPPTLSFHGRDDTCTPVLMSESLHKALDEQEVPNALSILEMRGHLFDPSEYSVAGQMTWYALERFIATVMPIRGR